MHTQLSLFTTPKRKLNQSEAEAGFAQLKADVSAMEFQTDICRVSNLAYQRHDDDGLRGRCNRCGSPMPRIFVRQR